MGGDEAELVAAGKEPDEDQSEGRIAKGAGEHLAHPVLAAGPGRGCGGPHERQGQERGEDHARKDDEDHLPGHHREQRLGQRWPDDLPAGSGRRCDGQRHGAVFVARSPAHHGEDHTEPGSGDAEADKDLVELMLDRCRRPGREQ